MKRFFSRRWVRISLFVLSSLGVALLAVAGYMLYLQVVHLTTPGRDPEIGRPAGLAYREVTLTTADGLHLDAWYAPGTRDAGIVLVHGIHANRTEMLPQAYMLSAAGYPLLLLDLRGHGRSEGEQLTYGYLEALDVQAGVDYLLAQPGIEQVGAIGHSLGGAAVVHAAAADERLAALVIQSSYSSLPQAVEDGFDDFALLPRWPFAPLVVFLAERRLGLRIDQVDSCRDLAAMAPRPVLLIHGADDALFPATHALQMYAAAQEPKTIWVIEGLPHANAIIGHEAAYEERVLDFLTAAFGDGHTTP